MTEEIKTEQNGDTKEKKISFVRRNKLMLAMLAAGAVITTVNPYVGVPIMAGALVGGASCKVATFVEKRVGWGLVGEFIRNDAGVYGVLGMCMFLALSSDLFSKRFPDDVSAYDAAKSAITKKLVAFGNGGAYPEPIQDNQGRYMIAADNVKVITTKERDAKTGKEEEEVSVKAHLKGKYQRKRVSSWMLRPYKEVVEIDEPIREIVRNVPSGSPILGR